MKTKQNGFTYLEILLSLGVSLGLLASLGQVLRTQARLALRVFEVSSHQQTADFLRETIQQAVRNSERYYFLQNFVNHHAGRIEDFEGRPLALGTGKTAILPGSDALSFLHLDTDIVFRRDTGFENSSQYCVEVYRPIPQAKLLEASHALGFLALSVDGFREYKTVAVHLSKNPVCPSGKSAQIQIAPLARTIFASPLPAQADSEELLVQSAELLIPIEDSFSFYLSAAHTLRRVSHLSNENQPILQGIERLQLLETRMNENSVRIDIQFFFQSIASQKKWTFVLPLFQSKRTNQSYLDVLA